MLHSILGFPMYPGGQVQRDRWSFVSQRALYPHGEALQASIHFPRWQIWLFSHSGSVEHSASGGERQPVSGATRPPSGHTHATARKGRISTGLQMRSVSQGFPWHKSTHRAFTHPRGRAQSESVVHSSDCWTWMQPRVYGSPLWLGRHSHTGRWSLAVQTAPGAQLFSEHAGWQNRLSLLHIWVSSQSSLYWQVPEIQARRGSPCVPGGQRQVATWAITSQTASRPQGLPSAHGSRQ